MSVTGADCRAGATINSGNGPTAQTATGAESRTVTPTKPRRGDSIGTRNKAIEDMSAEELERYGRVLVLALGGPVSEEERLRRRRRYRAEKTGKICGKCGRELSADEKVYRTELKWMTVLCEGCAPKYMKRDHDPYAFRRYVTEPCDSCRRLVVFEATGRDRYRRHVFCCGRCRWTYYNAERNERNARAREKVCEVCGEGFTASRRDAKTCSPPCKQKAYRRRKQEAEKGRRAGAP